MAVSQTPARSLSPPIAAAELRKIGVNVFGMASRKESLILQLKASHACCACRSALPATVPDDKWAFSRPCLCVRTAQLPSSARPPRASPRCRVWLRSCRGSAWARSRWPARCWASAAGSSGRTCRRRWWRRSATRVGIGQGLVARQAAGRVLGLGKRAGRRRWCGSKRHAFSTTRH